MKLMYSLRIEEISTRSFLYLHRVVHKARGKRLDYLKTVPNSNQPRVALPASDLGVGNQSCISDSLDF